MTEISKTKFKLPRVVPCENEFEFQANACLYLTRKRKGVHEVDHMALLKLLWWNLSENYDTLSYT